MKARFDEETKLGLLQKAAMEQSELSHFFVCRNPLYGASLKASGLSFALAKSPFLLDLAETSSLRKRLLSALKWVSARLKTKWMHRHGDSRILH